MRYLIILLLLPILSFGQKSNHTLKSVGLNKIAEDYVRLGLAIGQYDPDFVDAYYGPDSLKPVGIKGSVFPKDSFLDVSNNLLEKLGAYKAKDTDTSLSRRAIWISRQLIATKRRIRIFSGDYASFDTEAKELFGIIPPNFTEDHFRNLVTQLDRLLPGQGSVNERFQKLANRFIIPRDKLDTLYKVSIAESRKRTLRHYSLPKTENFRVEYVTNKPWSGYNWYQGNFKSLIQFNTDVSAFIEKAIDVACHEGYPGHHVYNTLLEKNLYRDRGQVEISLYPLFSPQSLIAEGSANYGIDVVFPGEEKIQFAKNVLLPLAGLDTTGLTTYFRALEIKGKLQYVHTEVARRLVDGKMTDKEAVRWTMEYGLFNEGDAVRALAFKKKYRSYVINYTIGQDVIRSYIESKGGSGNNPEKRWDIFERLLSNQLTAADLQ
ncbi:hypothetical protein GZH53_03095 [Flavihumibacter sp. R14]|nr:hypothetical protein [Flavihumibacter soli]